MHGGGRCSEAAVHGGQHCSEAALSEASVGEAYSEGTVCTFSCKENTALHGQHNTTCTHHGTWDAEPPTCVG